MVALPLRPADFISYPAIQGIQLIFSEFSIDLIYDEQVLVDLILDLT
jgi:hypothetical protein